MARRLRLGNAFGIEMVSDSSWVLSLILPASVLVAVGVHPLPFPSSAALALLDVAAAIGVFASLAVHELAHGLSGWMLVVGGGGVALALASRSERVAGSTWSGTTARRHQGVLES
jgi:hypothetical protein